MIGGEQTYYNVVLVLGKTATKDDDRILHGLQVLLQDRQSCVVFSQHQQITAIPKENEKLLGEVNTDRKTSFLLHQSTFEQQYTLQEEL